MRSTRSWVGEMGLPDDGYIIFGSGDGAIRASKLPVALTASEYVAIRFPKVREIPLAGLFNDSALSANSDSARVLDGSLRFSKRQLLLPDGLTRLCEQGLPGILSQHALRALLPELSDFMRRLLLFSGLMLACIKQQ